MTTPTPTLAHGQWFDDGKFGLFIHFGLYSQMGGAYKGQPVPGITEWIQHTARIPFDEYRQLADTFNPTAFDADAIARRAKRWGMTYICLTSKHHEGFALFDSAASDYNAVAACGRDLVAELAEACRTHGLVLCLYYSQAQDWAHPDGYVADRDNSGKDFGRYLEEKCIPQLTEILTAYGPLGMIWFDTPMHMTPDESKRLVDHVRSLQPDCLISGRIGNGLGDYITTQDNRIPAFPIEKRWEVPATLNHSWGYDQFDHDWHSPDMILTKLIHIVSRGGNYLLNIGPMGDGTIPQPSVDALDRIGDWIAVCGESIYGTRALPLYVYEAPEWAMTHKPHTLYLHVFAPDTRAGRGIGIPHILNTDTHAEWLNHDGPADLYLGQNLEGNPYWELRIPETTETVALTLKITTKEPDYLQESL